MVLPIMKKKCKACGNIVMVERKMVTMDKAGITHSPEDCATCRSLGVEKAIEQRLMCNRKNYRTKIEINDGKKQMFQEQKKKCKENLVKENFIQR